MGAQLKQGDWLIGVSPKYDGNRLVYAMRISERLTMNEYFDDVRFKDKKPKLDGTAVQHLLPARDQMDALGFTLP
jgi:hypothetical protein